MRYSRIRWSRGGTSLGNLIVQMIADDQIEDLQAARDMIRVSFDIDMVNPQE